MDWWLYYFIKLRQRAKINVFFVCFPGIEFLPATLFGEEAEAAPILINIIHLVALVEPQDFSG